VTVCEEVVPRLNKHDDVIDRNFDFMKIAPPGNEELVVPLVTSNGITDGGQGCEPRLPGKLKNWVPTQLKFPFW